MLQDYEDITLKIDTVDDGKFTLKAFLVGENINEEQLADRCSWLDILDSNVNFLLSFPLKNKERKYITEIKSDSFTRCLLYRWLDGENINKKLNESNIYRCGEMMAEMHNVAEREGADMCRRLWNIDPSWLQEVKDIVISGARDVGLSLEDISCIDCSFDKIARAMERLGYAPEVFGPIHADLNLANVIVHKDKWGIIDFEDSGRGHYLLDLGVTIADLAYYPERLKKLSECLLAGYNSTRTPPDIKMHEIEPFCAASEVLNAEWIYSPINKTLQQRKPHWGRKALNRLVKYGM